ncbi:EthD domain-containing protein [Nocardia sp. NPDC050408]|uniref:EthD domain-containing protein n=1 Tax=Nocardia sp. NPDC050408 TaxID=3364319 RepID=UPI00378CEF67
MSKGLLFSQMAPPKDWEADFEDWYETEHIPARMEIPGFSHALRYHTDTDPWHLAAYFIDDMAALETPQYKALKSDPSERTARMLANVTGFTRYITDQISDTADHAPSALTGTDHSLFVVAFGVPETDRAEFEGWYEEEHVPLLMEVPGWLRVRRYLVRPGFDGPVWSHLALHEIASPEVLDAPERDAARNTPRRDALASRPWFTSGRWTYRPISIAHSTTKGN